MGKNEISEMAKRIQKELRENRLVPTVRAKRIKWSNITRKKKK